MLAIKWYACGHRFQIFKHIVSRSDAQSRHNFLGDSVALYKVILPSPPFQYQGIRPKGTKMSWKLIDFTYAYIIQFVNLVSCWCVCGNWHDQHTSEISLPWIKHYFFETRKHVLFSAYQVSMNVHSSHNTETLFSLTHDSQPLRYTDIKNGRDFLKICCNQFMLTDS